MDDLLDDHIIPKEKSDYPPVNKALRFINYVVDYTCLIIPLTTILLDFINRIPGNNYMISNDNFLVNYFIIAITITIYYTYSEYYFNGKTFGKILTGTRVVTLENQPINFNTALKRSISRIIPFEALSFIGDMPTGWHDQWTNTKVIKDKGWKEEL